MSDEKPMGQVIQIDETRIRDHFGEMVRGTVEETLNAMLDAEADQLYGPDVTSAAKLVGFPAFTCSWPLNLNVKVNIAIIPSTLHVNESSEAEAGRSRRFDRCAINPSDTTSIRNLFRFDRLPFVVQH
jgi:hypothetical protein